MNLQRKLFDIIKSRTLEQYRMSIELEEVLGVSQDAVYRRMRGDTELSLTEVSKLCKHYNLSVDKILSEEAESVNTQNGSFIYMPVNMTCQPSYINYIERLSKTLSALTSVKDKEMFFTAQDIPFYHFLNQTDLLFFKLYVWADIINKEKVLYKEFCSKLDKKAILSIYEDMYRAYMRIPSKEIWTEQTIDTILRLLMYYAEMNAFEDKQIIHDLLNQLSDIIDSVSRFARNGFKGQDTPFSMYICSVDLENNFMLTRRGDKWTCTIKLYTVNNIATDNVLLCRETEQWINDLIGKSTMISGGSSQKNHFLFFQKCKNRIEELRINIEALR
ncbi:MAG: helix-turn-helix transcriptional regulator [Tannerellaceae bacterium]|jgi:transcriptional regulator with XRE-family HTH domain|nr:helix-turn-helix transcriptional regulator [Tannerellaceae bacterium]